jgi:DNA-binding CsgD family transcriptional regulator
MVNTNEIEKIFTLWDALSELGARKIDPALNLCLKQIGSLVGARNAFWVGTVRMAENTREINDPLHGWRIRGIQYMEQPYFDPVRVRAAMQSAVINDPGATNIALAATAGRFRSYRLTAQTLVALSLLRQTEHYDIYYTQPGVIDRLWVVFPIGVAAESIFCFDRFNGQEAFTDDELECAAFALRGIRWFHRQLLLSHGLGICEAPLTPAERRIKQGLLSGATEKELAQQLNLTPGTIHQYAMRIYRKFGVNGRAEFMSLWMSGSS